MRDWKADVVDPLALDPQDLALYAVAQSDDAIVIKALDGTVISWNRGACRMFGWEAVDIVGRNIRLLIPPDRQGEEELIVDRMCAGEEIRHFETRRLRRDGSQFDVSVNLSPVRNAAGEVVAVSKIARDISDRVKAEREAREAAERLRMLYERTPAMLQSVDGRGRLLAVSDAWLDALGLSRAEVVGRRALEFLTPQSRAQVRAFGVRRLFAGDRATEFECQLVRSDGGVIDAVLSAIAERDSKGTFQRSLVVLIDVTEKRRLAARAWRQHELRRVTLESIGDAVITTDRNGIIDWMNPVAQRLTGWTEGEGIGHFVGEVFHVVHEETRGRVESPVLRALRSEAVSGLGEKSMLLCRDGQERAVEDSAAPIRDELGRVLGAVLVFHDVSEQRRLAREVTYRATRDPLTGLCNRTEFDLRLERAFTAARDDGASHVLLYIDLDQFKLVNDACGHAAGDALLRDMAALLRGAVRQRDTLARLGGDEFGVLMEHCTAVQARRVAQGICDRMQDFRFLHEGRRFRIGTSIGLVAIDGRWPAAAEVMKAADAACYAAKEAGRNRVHEWFESDASLQALHGGMRWASRLEQALDEDAFMLYAQRIVPVAAGGDAGTHLEVLLRLAAGEGHVLLPGAFIPAAERYNKVTLLDRWVLSQVVQWLESHHRGVACLSVNVSAMSLGDPQFHGHALSLMDRLGGLASRLCLEITETAAIAHMAAAVDFVRLVRARGVKVALDDFGVGASAFGYLKHLPVDFLKIDGQFIRDLLTDRMDHAAVCCFRDVARICGIRTVAEFVQSQEVLDELGEIGIDFAQGFHLHEPEPLDNLAPD